MPKKSDVGLRPCRTDDGSILIELVQGKGKDKVVLDTFEAGKLSDYPDNVQTFMEYYGVTKLFMDRTSGVEMGLDKLDGMREFKALFEKGELKKERVGGLHVVAVHIEAISRVGGHPIPTVQASWKAASEEQRTAILANPKVKAEIVLVKEERANQSDVALDDLL